MRGDSHPMAQSRLALGMRTISCSECMEGGVLWVDCMMKVWHRCYFVKTASVPCMPKRGVVAALELFEYGLSDRPHPTRGVMVCSGTRREHMKGTPWVL